MSSENAAGTVRIKLVRSPNSTPANHRLCVKALGLKRMHQVVELKDSPSVRGLIEKVNYLVRVES
ncbi:MAG: 50S ribosomal protein L30 [Xanthomonadales bacterium]|nr:50S ribosomal protein L30 [Xanthomonadales bacterium]